MPKYYKKKLKDLIALKHYYPNIYDNTEGFLPISFISKFGEKDISHLYPSFKTQLYVLFLEEYISLLIKQAINRFR